MVYKTSKSKVKVIHSNTIEGLAYSISTFKKSRNITSIRYNLSGKREFGKNTKYKGECVIHYK